MIPTPILLLLACFIIIIIYQYHEKKFLLQKGIKELNASNQKAILQSQLEIQEQTFQKISCEIHDNISLTLSLSKLHLNNLNYSDPGEIHDKINYSIFLIGKAINDLNTISKSLNTDFIVNNGLIRVVENQLNELKRTGAYTVDFEIKGSSVSLGSNNELIIFRIIQESLNNILKHSRASVVTVKFSFTANGLEVAIHDNGIGFAVQEKGYLATGSGLNNMRKRAQLLNASISITSETGKGTLIKLLVPN